MAKKNLTTPSIDASLIKGEAAAWGAGMASFAQGFEDVFGNFAAIAGQLEKEREAYAKERRGIIAEAEKTLYELPEYDPYSTNLNKDIELALQKELEKESNTAEEIVGKLSKVQDLNSREAIQLKHELSQVKKRMTSYTAEAADLDKQMREQLTDITTGNFSRAADPALLNLIKEISQGKSTPIFKNGSILFSSMSRHADPKTQPELFTGGINKDFGGARLLKINDIFSEAALQKEDIETATKITAAQKLAVAAGSGGKFDEATKNEVKSAIELALRDVSTEQLLSIVTDDLFIGGPHDPAYANKPEDLRKILEDETQGPGKKQYYITRFINGALEAGNLEQQKYENNQRKILKEEAFNKEYSKSKQADITNLELNFGIAPQLQIGNDIYEYDTAAQGYKRRKYRTIGEGLVSVDDKLVYKNIDQIGQRSIGGSRYVYSNVNQLTEDMQKRLAIEAAPLNVAESVTTQTNPNIPEGAVPFGDGYILKGVQYDGNGNVVK